MARGILLAGNESLLFSAAAGEADKRVEQYCAAAIRGTAQSAAESGKKIPLTWNPGSSISGRTLLLSAENQLGKLSDILLICSPPALYCPVESLVPAEIENHINTQIKGWFFLIRETAIYLRAKGGGSLGLVIAESGPPGGESISDLPGAAASAAFHALAQELIASAASQPFLTMGFTFSETSSSFRGSSSALRDQEKEFAAWMFKILDEGGRKKSGKWHRFGKTGLFRKN